MTQKKEDKRTNNDLQNIAHILDVKVILRKPVFATDFQ